jgi:hypothetical protein
MRLRVRWGWLTLLADAEAAGGLTDAVAKATVEEILSCAAQSGGVLLTCSTLGPAVDLAMEKTAVPILRVDAALAAQATADGGEVVVLCAVETTIEPTRLLFERASRATDAIINVVLVRGAWSKFKAGDNFGYLKMVAEAADEASRRGARVVLAQASMAGAASLCAETQPLTSPAAGLRAISEAQNHHAVPD